MEAAPHPLGLTASASGSNRQQRDYSCCEWHETSFLAHGLIAAADGNHEP